MAFILSYIGIAIYTCTAGDYRISELNRNRSILPTMGRFGWLSEMYLGLFGVIRAAGGYKYPTITVRSLGWVTERKPRTRNQKYLGVFSQFVDINVALCM